MLITWRVIPLDTPRVLKKCSRCGLQRGFICTGQFRVNAQQKKLDVWLIWQCEKCGCTWNMDVLSRIKADDLKEELYKGFLNNERRLAYAYAFDGALLARNKVEARWEHIAYDVEGPALTAQLLKTQPVTLLIQSRLDLHLRLDRFLCRQLGMTQTELQAHLLSGAIACDAYGFQPEKPSYRIRGDVRIHFALNV